MANKASQEPGCAFQPVTAHQPFTLGATDLFAVQGGVPLTDALDAMAMLLSTARGAAREAAEVDAGRDNDGAVWAVEHLLALAQALTESVYIGVKEATNRTDTKSREGAPCQPL